MRLSDPFGRLESRHQAGYETMRDTLRNSGVDTPKAAREIIAQAKKRAIKFYGVAIIMLLSMIWLPLKIVPIVFGLALFLLVWVTSSTLNGQRYIEQYIDKDLK